MQRPYLLALFSLLLPTAVLAQTTPGGVRIGAAGAPDAKAILDLSATGKGLLIPRMDSVTRVGIGTPPDGLMVFQTDGRKGFWYAMNAAWLFIPDKARSGDNLGSHTATQNLNLADKSLVGGTAAAPGTVGLRIDGNGLATFGAPRPDVNTITTYGLRLTDLDQDFILTSKSLRGKTNPLNISGAGDRLTWLSYYSAFRAGGVTGNQWDYPFVGQYSAAFGLDNQAQDLYSTLFGYSNRVRAGEGTFVTGRDNEGLISTYGLMTGQENALRGRLGFVGGLQSKTQSSTTNPYPSFTFGYRSQARSSQGFNFALGYYARTGGYSGCFVVADYSPLLNPDAARQQDSLVSTTANQYSARFAGGYRLFTTAATTASQGTAVGVRVDAGGNSWQTLSDSTKKEHRVLADGNLFLARINRLRLGSWNYRGQSPDTMRHYGPMAQDFYAAFGHDGVGRSGNATTINQADFDGVNLIAIQALYRRLLLLEAENARQQQLIRQLEQARAATPPAPATAATDHAALLQLQAQVARLLAEQPQAQR